VATGSAVSQAAARRQAAEAQLALVEAGAREEQRQLTRIAVQQAEAALAEADLAVTQAETTLASAEAGLVQSEAALSAAQQALAGRTLLAPFAATVAHLPLEIGEVAAPGFPAVVVADLSSWLIKTTDLGENKVVTVAAGYPVDVAIVAFPDQILPGTVTDIAPLSNVNRDENNYVVTISLDDTDGLPLRWGMTTFVTIDVESKLQMPAYGR
jgi:multidrug resistance efflux pump